MVTDGALALRKGVSNVRITEYKEYLANLIQAKEAGIDPALVQWPLMTDRAKVGIDGSVSLKSNVGAEAGIAFSFLTAKGSYGRASAEAARLALEMEFMSSGAPDFERLQVLSVDELRKLIEVLPA